MKQQHYSGLNTINVYDSKCKHGVNFSFLRYKCILIVACKRSSIKITSEEVKGLPSQNKFKLY